MIGSIRFAPGGALVAVAAAVLLIAGCSSPSGGGPAPEAAPESSNDDGGNGANTGDTDENTGLAKEIPANFPPEIPLISGEVGAAIDVGTGWSVLIIVDDIDAAFEQATSDLVGAGFAEDYNQTGDDGAFAQYQSDAYTVQVTGVDQPDYGPSVTYLVVIKG